MKYDKLSVFAVFFSLTFVFGVCFASLRQRLPDSFEFVKTDGLGRSLFFEGRLIVYKHVDFVRSVDGYLIGLVREIHPTIDYADSVPGIFVAEIESGKLVLGLSEDTLRRWTTRHGIEFDFALLENLKGN